jgi:hypothetical protein
MLRSGQTPGYKPTHGSSQSSVGNRSLYEAGDQRIEPQSAINERDRYKEGVKNSHQNLDAKDERSIANKVANQGKQSDSSHHHHHISDPETEMSKQDPTKPVRKAPFSTLSSCRHKESSLANTCFFTL